MTISPDEEPTTEQPRTEERPPGAPPARRLTRTSDDRILGGVAGGLGRYFGVDPIIPRIAFAALVFAGGFGVLAYVAAWLFVPDDETGETAASTSKAAAFLGIAVLIAAIAALTDGDFLFFSGPGIFVVLIAALLGYAIWKSVSPRSGGSVLGRLVLVTVIGIAALSAMAGVTVFAALGGDTLIASLIIVAGLFVVAGAASGRMRWLLVPAVVLAIPAGVVAATDFNVEGGVGDRQYRPASMTDVREGYELGIGELVVDLRDVDFPAGRTEMELDLGVGRAVVLVPEDVCVAPEVHVGVGEARVLGLGHSGVDVDLFERPRTPVTEPSLALDAEVGIGEVIVAYDASALDQDSGFWDDWDGGDPGPAVRLYDGGTDTANLGPRGQVCDRNG